MKSRFAVPASTSSPLVPRITLNQPAPATPVTARPTPRASARTISLRAIGTSVESLRAHSTGRPLGPRGRFAKVFSARGSGFRRRAAGRRGQLPRRLGDSDLRRAHVWLDGVLALDHVHGDDQVGADEPAGVEGPLTLGRGRELLDHFLGAFHGRAEVAE